MIAEQRSLRIITFNIAHGRGLAMYQGFSSEQRIRNNLKRISHYLKETNADIVCLQEVDANSHWTKRLNLLEILQEQTGYEHAVHGLYKTRSGKKPLAYGNAILSRYKIKDWTNHIFQLDQKDLWEKGFVCADIAIGKTSIPVLNIHLDFRSRKRRLKQIEQVMAYLSQRSNSSPPAIICGDFNTHSRKANDAVAQLFAHIVQEDSYALYPRNARTFPAYLPSRGLDFVFLPKGLQHIEHSVGRELLSDHRPVLLDFKIPEKA